MLYDIEVQATDWCGYTSDYHVIADSKEEATEKATQLFIDEWDIVEYEDGMYGEFEDFDDEGEPLEEDSLTSISIDSIVEL